jgi:hypothetical protein
VKTIAAALVLCFFACAQASAEVVVLSCAVEETGANHARRILEITFDQQNQLVYLGKTVSTASITDTRVTFRVDLGAGVPFSFSIDRTNGSISVTSDVRSLYNGQCKVTDPSHRTLWYATPAIQEAL